MKIAIVSAYPVGLNTGMLSSDLAFRSFLARRQIAAEVHSFSMGSDLTFPFAPGKAMHYRTLIRWEELRDFDRILFWGDFLHSRRFHRKDLVRNAQMSDTPLSADEVYERAFSALLLEGAPEEVLQKAICFGGTIYINSLLDGGDRRYVDALSRLYRSARLVLMRDPVSAALAERYRSTESALGVDCALLLEPFETFDWRSGIGPGDTISFSFNRRPSSSRSTKRLMHRLVDRLGRHVETREHVPLEWLKADPSDPMGNLLHKLRQIRRSKVVITDTYHCAVNAWREGVPAICVGTGAEHAGGTLSDKKKELFLGMFGAGEFYVFTEALKRWDGVHKNLGRLEPALQYAPIIAEAVGDAAKRAEDRLADALLN